MTYREFCNEIAPQVIELQNECRNMSLEEFQVFREDIMKVSAKSDLSKKFMTVVLDMIEKNIFEKSEVRADKTA